VDWLCGNGRAKGHFHTTIQFERGGDLGKEKVEGKDGERKKGENVEMILE
jgi:hypothetical protein